MIILIKLLSLFGLQMLKSKTIIFLISLAALLSGCIETEYTVNEDDITLHGDMICNSPKYEKTITFHTTAVISVTNAADPYVTVKMDDTETSFYMSEGWSCIQPDGSKKPLITKE
jgi:hypothetical protein